MVLIAWLPLAVIVQLPPDSPLWLRAGAALILVLHIGGGALAILSGAAALALPKGKAGHRLAGDLFFAAMTTMTAAAAVAAPFTTQPGNTVGAVFACYLVTTGWMTVMRAPGVVSLFDVGAVMVPVATATICLMAGLQALSSPTGLLGGLPPEPMLVLAAVAAIAAGADSRVIWRRGVSGDERLARHLWRMCVAFLIALGSALTQPRLVPTSLSGSPALLLPVIVVVGLMIFWLLRVGRTRPRASDPARAPHSPRMA